MDDGSNGNYTSLVGYNTPYLLNSITVTSNSIKPIVRGLTYKFRYRAKNCIGWGSLSQDLYVLAASAPAAPPSPI